MQLEKRTPVWKNEIVAKALEHPRSVVLHAEVTGRQVQDRTNVPPEALR